jgi:hypothetical protein
MEFSAGAVSIAISVERGDIGGGAWTYCQWSGAPGSLRARAEEGATTPPPLISEAATGAGSVGPFSL